MRAHVFSVILAGILLAALGGSGQAQPYGPPRDGRDGVQPLDRLLPGIRRNHPGDFYDAEGPTYGPSGDPHYHLKWMTPDGRVIWYDTDARSGRVLRSSPGRDSFDAHRPDAPPPGYNRPYMDRYPPRSPDAYERRNFGPGRDYQGPGYGRPDRDWSNRGWGASRDFDGGRGGRDFGGGREWNGGGGGRDFGGGRGGRDWGGGRGGRGQR
jgi:hypothetical protein